MSLLPVTTLDSSNVVPEPEDLGLPDDGPLEPSNGVPETEDLGLSDDGPSEEKDTSPYYFIPGESEFFSPNLRPMDRNLLPWKTYSHHSDQTLEWKDYRRYYQLLSQRCGWTQREARLNLRLHLSGPAIQLTKHLDLQNLSSLYTLEGLLEACDECFQPNQKGSSKPRPVTPPAKDLPTEQSGGSSTTSGTPPDIPTRPEMDPLTPPRTETPTMNSEDEMLNIQKKEEDLVQETHRRVTKLRRYGLPAWEINHRLTSLCARQRLPEDLGYNAQSLNETELASYIRNLYHSSHVTQAETDFYHQNGFKIIRTRDFAGEPYQRDHMELICWKCHKLGKIKQNCPFRHDTTTALAHNNWVPASALPFQAPYRKREQPNRYYPAGSRQVFRPRPRQAVMEDLTEKMTKALRTVAAAIANQPSGPHEVSITVSMSKAPVEQGPVRPDPTSQHLGTAHPPPPSDENYQSDNEPLDPDLQDDAQRDRILENELFQYFCQPRQLQNF